MDLRALAVADDAILAKPADADPELAAEHAMSPRIGSLPFALALALTLLPRLACAATATGHVSVEILPTAVAVAEVSPIAFAMPRASNAGGKIALAPSGAVTAPGGVSSARTATPGIFTITGPANSAIAVSFSADSGATGPGPALSVGSFRNNAGRAPVLDNQGRLTMAVGATLAMAPSQANGAYAGSYTVIVNY